MGKLPKLKYLNVANTSIGFDVVDELNESREDLQVDRIRELNDVDLREG